MKLDIKEDFYLDTLRESHAQGLFDLTDRNRAHLKEWLPWLDRTTKTEDTLGFIKMIEEKAKREQGLVFAIFYEGSIVGIVGHNTVDYANKVSYLGYWLGSEFSGLGIMTRAVARLIEYSFQQMGMNSIEIAAAKENFKSRAIPERLGFHHDGILREREWLYDHFVDHATYSLLKREWPGFKSFL